jgi:uncharacterized membrane protein
MNGISPERNGVHKQKLPLTDECMELLMGRLLQTGVLAAAAVVAVGGVLYVLHHGGEPVSYRRFQPKPLDLRHPFSMVADLRRWGSVGIVGAGILILIATPICRVIFALVSFAMERDRLYVAVSAVVLAALLFGLWTGG